MDVDKTWCTPDKTSGEMGENSVTFEIADAFEAAETAKVTLTIGEDKDVVTFNITRSAKEREFNIADADGAAVTSLTFGDDAKTAELRVNANFWWQLDADDDCNAQWPAWLSKPSPRFEGKAGEYVTVTLAVDEAQLPNFYDSKEGVIYFNDVNNPELTWSLAVNHTFEKPVFLASDRGTSLRLDMTNNFYDIDGNTTTDRSVTFKMTPEPGEVNYQVYMYVDKVFYGKFPPTGQPDQPNSFYHGLDELSYPYVQTSATWISLSETETNMYSLAVKDFAKDEITRNTNGSLAFGQKYTDKVYYFVVPASVYGNFLPDQSGLSSMRGRFFDSSNKVNEDMQKYLIEVVCDNPYTGIAE